MISNVTDCQRLSFVFWQLRVWDAEVKICVNTGALSGSTYNAVCFGVCCCVCSVPGGAERILVLHGY